MKPLPPIDVVPLFPDERAALLGLLRSLTSEQWELPTVCAGWSVKDIAAHLVSDDLGRLATLRDGYGGGRFEPTNPETAQEEFVPWINARNESWVEAMRRLSPRMLIEMLVWAGTETQAYFETLDPETSDGFAVSWAGEIESANWFDMAREFTERWHHQSQIRDAIGAPMLDEPRFLAPLIQTMVRSIPPALLRYDAAPGTTISVDITDLSWAFDIVREGDVWLLTTDVPGSPDAVIAMSGDTAWRMLTRNLPRDEIVARSKLSGDEVLASAVFDSFALVV